MIRLSHLGTDGKSGRCHEETRRRTVSIENETGQPSGKETVQPPSVQRSRGGSFWSDTIASFRGHATSTSHELTNLSCLFPQGQSTSADGTIVTLQEQLAEKERQIKRIKEQRDRAEKEKGEEAALMQKSSTEQIAKAEDLRRQLDEKTSELTDLR